MKLPRRNSPSVKDLETEFLLLLDHSQDVLVFERAQLCAADIRAACLQ